MPLSIRPLHPAIAGEVAGIDITKSLKPEDVAAIEAGMDKYAVLVFPGQNLTDEQQMAFTVNFGAIEDALLCYTSLPAFEEHGLGEQFRALAGRCWEARGFSDYWAHVLVAEGSADLRTGGWLSAACTHVDVAGQSGQCFFGNRRRRSAAQKPLHGHGHL